jgi:hypothetical protein
MRFQTLIYLLLSFLFQILFHLVVILAKFLLKLQAVLNFNFYVLIRAQLYIF